MCSLERRQNDALLLGISTQDILGLSSSIWNTGLELKRKAETGHSVTDLSGWGSCHPNKDG